MAWKGMQAAHAVAKRSGTIFVSSIFLFFITSVNAPLHYQRTSCANAGGYITDAVNAGAYASRAECYAMEVKPTAAESLGRVSEGDSDVEYLDMRSRS